MATTELMEPIARLDRDLRQAARLLGKRAVQYLVDAYYITQKNRIRADAQVRTMENEPNRLILWDSDNHRRFEEDYKRALNEFTDEYTVGRWLKSIPGIGPVISAGLLAHLDIRRAPHAGHFWSFAGLSAQPKVWKKGIKRPYNAKLKTLASFKLGECFVKVQNKDDDYYGKVFKKHRLLEEERNLSGQYKELAAKILEEKSFRDDTIAKAKYKEGLLPDAHLHARARRYAVKLFLSHLHEVMFLDFYDKKPPVPYAQAKWPELHSQYLPPPFWPVEEPAKSLRDMEE